MTALYLLPHLAIKKRCNRCNQERLPSEIVMGNDAAGHICMKCYYRHHQNLDGLAARRPRKCDECPMSFEELEDRQLLAEMKLFEKDGILALLCNACWQKYALKTHQLKGTLYEHVKKIR